MNPGDLIESARPWLSTAGIMGILAFMARWWFQNRKLNMVEKIQDRQGYGPLIKVLQTQLKVMQEDLAKLRKDLSVCQDDHMNTKAEHLKSKEEILDLRAEVVGLRRQLIAHSETIAVALGASSEVLEAGRRSLEASGE